VLVLSLRIYNRIIKELQDFPYEWGGIIGQHEQSLCADQFVLDKVPISSEQETSYKPNIEFLNDVLIREWYPSNIKLVGMVHTHFEYPYPSLQDKRYAKEIYDSIMQDDFHIVIFFNEVSNDPQLFSFASYYQQGVFNLASEKIKMIKEQTYD